MTSKKKESDLSILFDERIKLKKQKSVISKKLSLCSFMIEEAKLEPGLCTHSGACRFQRYDYMYQGGVWAPPSSPPPLSAA